VSVPARVGVPVMYMRLRLGPYVRSDLTRAVSLVIFCLSLFNTFTIIKKALRVYLPGSETWDGTRLCCHLLAQSSSRSAFNAARRHKLTTRTRLRADLDQVDLPCSQGRYTTYPRLQPSNPTFNISTSSPPTHNVRSLTRSPLLHLAVHSFFSGHHSAVPRRSPILHALPRASRPIQIPTRAQRLCSTLRSAPRDSGGSNLGVVTGFQTRDGSARVTWVGGIELFSDTYVNKPLPSCVELSCHHPFVFFQP